MGSITTDSSTKMTDFATLRNSYLSFVLSDRVFYPKDPEYVKSLSPERFWTPVASSLKPICVVIPTCTAEISTFVKAVNTLNQIGRMYDAQVKFAIRGGGHTPWAGAANIEGGILLDLQPMKGCKVDHENETVSVQPGERWKSVYTTLEEQELMVVGGRSADVGVGGLLTGGGISYYTPERGFACDNVANFEVVLSDGRIVNANATSNADLWKALKGGSNNFGIVSRFDLYTFKAGPLFGGQLVWRASEMTKVVKAFTSSFDPQIFDVKLAHFIAITWSHTLKDFAAFSILRNTQAEEKPKALEPYMCIENRLGDTLRVSPMSDQTEEMTEEHGVRNAFATTSFTLCEELMLEIVDHFKQNSSPVQSLPKHANFFAFQAVPPSGFAQSERRGGNAMNITDVSKPLVFGLLRGSWEREEDGEKVYTWMKDFIAWVETRAKKLGVYNSWQYLNYSAQWQDPISGYGEEGKSWLKEVSKKYDPEGFFQEVVPGGHKL